MLLNLPVLWCLGDEPMMHEPGAVPKTLARRVIALPLTDPLVVSKNSCRKASEARPPLLALACCRVCWTIPGRHRAQVSRARCVLTIGRRELTTWVVFVAALAVGGGWAPRCGRVGQSSRGRACEVASGRVTSRVMGGDRVGRRLGGAYAPLWTSLNLPTRAARTARRPIAGTCPVWGKSWRCRYLQELGRTRS